MRPNSVPQSRPHGARWRRIESVVDESVGAGARIVTGGHSLDRPGFYFPPTILAIYLLRRLVKIAAEQGIIGFTADVLPDNSAMLNSFRKVAAPVEIQTNSGISGVRFQLKDVKPPPGIV